MVVVGRLVGTFEPARTMVAIAHAKSASARANTIAPSHPAGAVAGTNGKGSSQLSASPASTATAHAIGGRILTFAVSVVSAMAGLGAPRKVGRQHPRGYPDLAMTPTRARRLDRRGTPAKFLDKTVPFVRFGKCTVGLSRRPFLF